jgi:hypothetical protein
VRQRVPNGVGAGESVQQETPATGDRARSCHGAATVDVA